MVIRVVLLAIISLVFFAACAKSPQYLVKGLTLPPGSSVVNEMTGKHDAGSTPIPMPGGGEVNKTISVMFDCSGGWSSVSSHIDGCMRSAGYSDAMEALGGQGIPQIPGVDIANIMRTYTKTDGKHSVVVMNNAATAAMGGGAGGAMQDMGDFTLTVIEFK